ncbi:putative non-specific serine/threonine protein kinase [Helianthus annuus]|nr:putative non-specific serine/threonine protein kinase [Helianthus annuus]
MMSGAIPGDLGNLTSIERLVLSSNFFTGKLPLSFANMINMMEFRISGNNFSGKIPDFIGEWTSLTTLRIQASGLEGPIPSSITLLDSLTDLRISDLRGPDTVCPPFSNTARFKHLFLRSCNLIGQLPVLPQSLASSLKVFYLTGNLLSGNVPDWMLSMIPSHWSSIYIDCGGDGLSIGNDSYESDLEDGGASFFTSTESRWGFSNTGQFLGNDVSVDNYTVKNTSRLLMNNPGLYMSARVSSLSLTYYGFCLVNGSYNVSLHFAEIVFTDDETYSSLGRRVFDIYIQGEWVEKDFDISNEAGGVGKEIVKSYTVNVNATLFIRLSWAGKGTTSIPSRGVYGPLISAISVKSSKLLLP